MANNFLVLDGEILKIPKHSQSPAGVPHCHFVIEHQSQQLEADLVRQAKLRIQVVVSGMASHRYAQDIFQGSVVRVTGFLNRHESRNGVARLVLHAQNIERIN